MKFEMFIYLFVMLGKYCTKRFLRNTGGHHHISISCSHKKTMLTKKCLFSIGGVIFGFVFIELSRYDVLMYFNEVNLLCIPNTQMH